MKILILTDKLHIGGAETHIAQTAQKLAKRGESVLVASAGGVTAELLKKQGIPHVCMPLQTRSPIRWLLLRRKIKALVKRERIDVAHAHARVPALLICGLRRLGCAEIVTVHAKFRAGFFRRMLSRWGENSIAVSEDLRAYLHNVYKIPTQRITVIPNGIDFSLFLPTAERTVTNTLRILFVSRLDADCSRGAELLCEVAPALAQRIPDFQITIVGGGEKMAEIAERAEKINRILQNPHIVLCGRVENIAPLLHRQDIFVGVSRAALEATACGCAVILCGNEGYGGILGADTFLSASLSNFCARGAQRPSATLLLQDLVRLAESPALREKNAAECRQLAIDLCDADVICEKTIDVYRKSLHLSPRATVVIGGYFGCGNLGDDAILQAFIEYMHTQHPTIRIWALTKRPRKNKHRFGVKCVNRKNPFALALAFLRADAFLCGGGSLLQNLTGRLSLYYYLCMLRLAKTCGALPVLFAAGIGPLHGKNAQRATKRSILQCSYISLRDAESLRFLRGQGLDPSKLHLGADAALLLPTPPLSRTHALLERIDVPTNLPYVCVCLKGGSKTAESCRTIVTALRMFCREKNLLPIFLPLDKGDVSVNAAAARRLGGRLFLTDEPSDITALLKTAQLLVSMRLHGLILATTVSLPSVGIPTEDDPKIPSFCRLSAQEFLAPETLSAVTLVDTCQRIYQTKDTLRPLIAGVYRDLQKNAQKDLANIAAMVYNRGRYTKKSEDTP